MKQLPCRFLPIAAALAVTAIFTFGYLWGRRSARKTVTAAHFLVTGDSMAPTIRSGERCKMLAADRPMRFGDVVAIRWDNRPRIKRVVGLGGDVMDVVAGRLVANGTRIEDLLSDRQGSDWLPPSRVQVSATATSWRRPAEDSSWIVYGHRNPHRGGHLTAVMDDYPVNKTVRRILNPVDRLVIELRHRDAAPHSAPTPIDVAFYQSDSSVAVTTTTNGVARQRDARPPGRQMHRPDRLSKSEPGTAMPPEGVLDPSHPIAVKIGKQESQDYQFIVSREIEYRDDRRVDESRYPLRVPAGHVFVVGDNVPVSVDSRQVGALPASSVMGTIRRTASAP